MNIIALGSTAFQVGVVGDDPDGATLNNILRAHGIDPAGLISDPSRPTTTKTRIMAHMGLRFPQQVARIDKIPRHPVSREIEEAIFGCIQALAADAQVIMVSDYLSGLLTPHIVAAVHDISSQRR